VQGKTTTARTSTSTARWWRCAAAALSGPSRMALPRRHPTGARRDF